MKKIYTIITLLTVALAVNAQSGLRTGVNIPANIQVAPNQTPKIIHNAPSSTQAQGDTVFAFDGNYVYDWNSTLPATFAFAYEDLDGGQMAAPMMSSAFGPTSDFVFFFDIDPTSPILYGHADTVFFGGACSWFNPLGAADNWFCMGPITVPATGGTLSWRHNFPDGDYRDGYEILVNTAGITSGDFSNPAVFTVGDNAPSTAGDTVNTPYTVFNQRSVDVSAYAGQDIYIAFHHNANDMFILYITDIILTEGPLSVVSTEGNNLSLNQNVPNPANGSSMITYSLVDNSDVLFNICDVAGKVVYTENLANQSVGAHRLDINTTELADGIYFYSLTANGQKVTRKMVVANN